MTYPIDFLIALSTQQHQTKYARITALDINEMPLEEIKGKITGGGPVSIDGNSAVRRTCSLTMVADKSTAGTAAANDITNPYWALTNKFKLEVGLLNTINSSYPDIIWINQGIYAITSFSKSISPTSITISISGKDKMTLLNGEMGGLFSTSTTLDTFEQVAKDGSIKLEKRPIYNIIHDLLHLYSGEPEHNIIINDLDAYGYELWDYRGSKSNGEEMPMYIFREYEDNGEVAIRNITFDGDRIVYRITSSDATSTLVYDVAYDMATSSITFVNVDDEATSSISQSEQIALKNIIASQLYSKIDGVETVGGINFSLSKDLNAKQYKIQKIEYGDTAGYYQTELVYPGDLVMNAGEAVTAALDKIKSVLGDFEYFYDVDGRFIFQKKKIYVNNLFSPINGDTADPFVEVSPYTYDFEDDRLFTAISDSPAIGNIKNDFTIWGNKRSSNGGDKLPIHARYAIDKKPTRYRTFDYYTKVNDLTYLISESAQAINTKGEDQDQTSNTIVNYYTNDKDETIISSIKTPQGAVDGLYKKDGDSNDYIKASNEEIKNAIPDLNNFYSLILTDVKGQATDEAPVYKIEEEKFTIAPSETYYKKDNNQFVETDNLSNLEECYRLKEETTTYCAEGCREEATDVEVDWRELIWLMQRDYYQHNLDPDFTITLIKNNKDFAAARRTGYEQYYADMQAFWRNLYNPNGEAPTYITDEDDMAIRKYKGWNRAILLYPQTLDFWIDFLDTGGPLDDYSVKAIGCRPKVEQANSSGVTAIFYRETPDVEFVILPQETNNPEDDTMNLQKIYIQDNMKELFNISSQGKASNARADELIWQYACGSETVNFTCIPLYFLEPNTQIRYKGEDYIITKISVPLTYNGTMSLTTTKIIRPF